MGWVGWLFLLWWITHNNTFSPTLDRARRTQFSPCSCRRLFGLGAAWYLADRSARAANPPTRTTKTAVSLPSTSSPTRSDFSSSSSPSPILAISWTGTGWGDCLRRGNVSSPTLCLSPSSTTTPSPSHSFMRPEDPHTHQDGTADGSANNWKVPNSAPSSPMIPEPSLSPFSKEPSSPEFPRQHALTNNNNANNSMSTTAMLLRRQSTAVVQAAESVSWKSTRNSLAAGYLAGICGVLVGHPLDSIKVRLQTGVMPATSKPLLPTMTPLTTAASSLAPSGSSLLWVGLRRVAQQVTWLYAGMTGPLLTVGLLQSINFATYDASRRFLYGLYPDHDEEAASLGNNDDDDGTTGMDYLYRDALWQVATAGTMAGVVVSFITSPLLMIKTQQQTAGLSFVEAVRQTWRRGPYIGFANHMVAECWGRAVYFGTYEAMKRFLLSLHPPPEGGTARAVSDTRQLSLTERMISAAAAGTLSWSLVYPLDSIRSRLYAAAAAAPAAGTPPWTAWTMARHVYQTQGGWSAFFRGYTVTVLRAGPVGAAILPLYDWALDTLTHERWSTSSSSSR